MWHDVKRRAPYYVSDFTEGFRRKNLERTVGATVRLYFLNIMPAIAYTLDMNYRTGGNYGLNETILVSAIAALTFSLLGVQPLTIVGVTGLTNLFFYTTYDIMQKQGPEVNFLQFQAWVLIWSAITHWLTALLNISDYCRFVTDMTSETFGLYVGVIYIQKGIELLILDFDTPGKGWFSVLVCILFALFVYFVERAGTLTFGPFWFRKVLTDYTFAAAIILFTGFVHIPGQIKDAGLQFLPITKAFAPSTDRGWVVNFWHLPVKWILIALPFGCLVTLLFYFDNNVSSINAQSRAFPVKRPAGFHWDFFLLGCTTLVSGILGLPAPNGLVPQAPVHTEALCETRLVPEGSLLAEDGSIIEPDDLNSLQQSQPMKVLRTRVVEQRISHLAIGLLTLGTMTRPLLVALGLMPQPMFAGIFVVVGWGSVEGSEIVHKTLFLLRDRRQTPPRHPLFHLKRASILRYVAIQWFFFAAIIAISETIAGIGFPVVITILIPVRYYWVPRLLTAEELAVLDAPAANSEAVLVSLGGPLETEKDKRPARDLETGATGNTTKEKVGRRRRGLGDEKEHRR